MSRREKPKPKVKTGPTRSATMTRKNVDQESADRFAAAEAMSCLSASPFILPSNSSTMTEIKDTETITNNLSLVHQNNVSKRGKTRNRSRGGKRSPVKSRSAVSSPKLENAADHISSPNTTPSNNTNDAFSVSLQSLLSKGAKGIVKKQEEKEIRQENNSVHSRIKSSLQQMLEMKKASGDYISAAVLKLPLNIGVNENVKVSDSPSPNSVTSNESVELAQTTVDNILNPNRYDTPEASLPLKKRRLQTYKEGDPAVAEINEGVIDLTKDKQEKPKENNADGKMPHNTGTGLMVNPQTSLMLLTEVQMALQQDEDGDLPLHIAVVHENIVMVQKFVHLMSISGKSVDKHNKSQQTPLHLAVEMNFDQAVSVLLLAGANPSLVNKQGDSAIHLSIKHNCITALACMLTKSQHKVDINARNFDGLAPLHLAVLNNQIEMVKLLIRCGADINIQDGKSGRTPLFHAVEGNQLPLVILFHQCAANIDLTNYAGITAIMAAQARGFSEASSILMVGLDPKALMEHKEKEKLLMPNKKMPIPRIPSKSHLIVPSNQRGIKTEKTSEAIDTISQRKCSSTEKELETPTHYQDEGKSNHITNAIPTILEGKNSKSGRHRNKMKQAKPEPHSHQSFVNSTNSHLLSDEPSGFVNPNMISERTGHVKNCEEDSSSSNISKHTNIPSMQGRIQSSTENVTSINAKTASMLAAHLKNLKTQNLISSKANTVHPLNLTSPKREHTEAEPLNLQSH